MNEFARQGSHALYLLGKADRLEFQSGNQQKENREASTRPLCLLIPT